MRIGSTLLLCFHHAPCPALPTDKHVSGLRHERGKRLWFDVSEVPAGEGIMGAELRLYQRPAPRDSAVIGDGTYTISVYLVVSVEHG